MNDSAFVSAIQRAITQAKTIEEVDRLEKALENRDPASVQDLLGSSATFEKRKTPSEPLPLSEPPAKQPKITHKPPQGLSKLSGLNSITLSLLLDRAKHDSAFPDTSHLPAAPSWRSSAEAAAVGGHASLVVEAATVLCKISGAELAEFPARLLVLDLDTEERLLDLRLRLPEGAEVLDRRARFSGLSETSEVDEAAVSLEQAQTELLALVRGADTFIATSNFRLPHFLHIRHTRWLPTSLIFKTSEIAKKKIAGNFHVRNIVPQWHVRQTLLHEPSDNWQSETIETVAVGTARLIKIACAKFPTVLDNFLPKHHPATLWVTKAPRDSDLPAIFPRGTVQPIHWHFDLHEDAWLGETAVVFNSEDERNKIFDALPTIVDVHVSWDQPEGLEVTEELLRSAASQFGRVCAVRIPVRKNVDAGRPFGFISFLRPQDAAKMTAVKRINTGRGVTLLANLAQVDKKNPVKRVPLESRVVEIYKM